MEHLQKAGLAGASCVPRFVVVAAMLFKRDVRVNSLNNHNRHTHKSNNHRLQRPNSLNSLAEAEKGLRATSNKHAVLIRGAAKAAMARGRSEEHTSELQSRGHLVCRLLLEKKK